VQAEQLLLRTPPADAATSRKYLELMSDCAQTLWHLRKLA
jgi:hypothetical protein